MRKLVADTMHPERVQEYLADSKITHRSTYSPSKVLVLTDTTDGSVVTVQYDKALDRLYFAGYAPNEELATEAESNMDEAGCNGLPN